MRPALQPRRRQFRQDLHFKQSTWLDPCNPPRFAASGSVTQPNVNGGTDRTLQVSDLGVGSWAARQGQYHGSDREL